MVLEVLQIGNFVETLSDRSSLKELAFYEAQIQTLIENTFTENATTENAFDVLCLFHIFSQFHKNDIWGDDPFNKENEYLE